MRSRSYFALLSAAEQTEIIADVHAVLDSHDETAGRALVDLPYVTASFRYTVRDGIRIGDRHGSRRLRPLAPRRRSRIPDAVTPHATQGSGIPPT